MPPGGSFGGRGGILCEGICLIQRNFLAPVPLMRGAFNGPYRGRGFPPVRGFPQRTGFYNGPVPAGGFNPAPVRQEPEDMDTRLKRVCYLFKCHNHIFVSVGGMHRRRRSMGGDGNRSRKKVLLSCSQQGHCLGETAQCQGDRSNTISRTCSKSHRRRAA